MPSWNESDFTKRAGEIASQHVVSKKSLNDLSLKVARDEALNPNEIRTLVRLANVATFQEMFKLKDDGDKMVEFETGDPEVVIQRLLQEADMPAESANIHNDKLAYEIPDQMREKRQGFKFEEPAVEKVASEPEEAAPRLDMVALNLRKLASEFDIELRVRANGWEQKLAQLARTFRRAPGYGPQFSEFEKDAYAAFGEDVRPELTGIAEAMNRPYEQVSEEKVAELMDRHAAGDSAELTLLKEALELRGEYTKFKNGLAWIERNMPALGR